MVVFVGGNHHAPRPAARALSEFHKMEIRYVYIDYYLDTASNWRGFKNTNFSAVVRLLGLLNFNSVEIFIRDYVTVRIRKIGLTSLQQWVYAFIQ